MKHALELLTTIGQITGIASTILMVWVFYNEAFNGRGVLFYEPNIELAGFEFVFAVCGLVFQAAVMSLMAVGMKSKPEAEPAGHGAVKKGVYA